MGRKTPPTQTNVSVLGLLLAQRFQGLHQQSGRVPLVSDVLACRGAGVTHWLDYGQSPADLAPQPAEVKECAVC